MSTDYTTSAVMGMRLPIPGVTGDLGIEPPGLSWMELLVTAIGSALDQHNHTTGLGVPIPASAIAINAALPFANNPATGLSYASFLAQSLGGPYRSLYFEGNDLYVTDGVGNVVRITSSGSIVGTSGSIGGMSGAAAVSYLAPTFTFSQATNKNANVAMGVAIIADVSVTGGNAVSIQAPASLGASYSLTLPTALPSASYSNGAPLFVNSSGVLSSPINAIFPGNVSIPGTLTLAGPVTATTTMAVAGNGSFTGNLTVSGTLTAANISGTITGGTVSGNLTVTGTTTSNGALTVSAGGAAITGNASVSGTLGAGASTLASLTVSGAAGVTGNATVGGTLGAGASTLASLNVTGSATIGTSLSCAALTATGLNLGGGAISNCGQVATAWAVITSGIGGNCTIQNGQNVTSATYVSNVMTVNFSSNLGICACVVATPFNGANTPCYMTSFSGTSCAIALTGGSFGSGPGISIVVFG